MLRIKYSIWWNIRSEWISKNTKLSPRINSYAYINKLRDCDSSKDEFGIFFFSLKLFRIPPDNTIHAILFGVDNYMYFIFFYLDHSVLIMQTSIFSSFDKNPIFNQRLNENFERKKDKEAKTATRQKD